MEENETQELQDRQNLQDLVFKKLHSRRRTGLGLRMTALVDVIFLLLIFFLLTAKFRPQENFLPVRLPTAQADTARLGRVEPLLLYLFESKTGCEAQIGMVATIRIDDKTVDSDLASFAEKTAEVLKMQKRLLRHKIKFVSF